MIQSDDAPRQIAWTHEEEIALVKGWVAVFENSKYGNAGKEHGFWRVEPAMKITLIGHLFTIKLKSKTPLNIVIVGRLMVTEMTAQEKEQRDTFIEIKRGEVECHEREVAAQEYRACQEDIRFYLRPYDHLTGEQRMAMNESRAAIKARNLIKKIVLHVKRKEYGKECSSPHPTWLRHFARHHTKHPLHFKFYDEEAGGAAIFNNAAMNATTDRDRSFAGMIDRALKKEFTENDQHEDNDILFVQMPMEIVAQFGVIFLLFALGLEFSVAKFFLILRTDAML
nr:K(+) efflux antiporter 6 [Tanacetum cinerariifolium]